MVTLLSPAKINLFLHVTGKRADGFHELVSLMCPVSLYDEIDLEIGGSAVRVSCDHPHVPENETNLARRAAEDFIREAGADCRIGGAAIRIKKRIPIGAGLGGGSSNAAEMLCALNRLGGFPFSESELMKIGRGIGADVPFFVAGKPAVASGIGERLVSFPQLKPYKVLLVDPGDFVSTAEVYKNLDLGLTNCEKQLKGIPLKHQAFDPAGWLCNDLESVTFPRWPQVARAKSLLMEQGAAGALMTGSGSTVFGLFQDGGLALKAGRHLSVTTSWRVHLVDMIPARGDRLKTDT